MKDIRQKDFSEWMNPEINLFELEDEICFLGSQFIDVLIGFLQSSQENNNEKIQELKKDGFSQMQLRMLLESGKIEVLYYEGNIASTNRRIEENQKMLEKRVSLDAKLREDIPFLLCLKEQAPCKPLLPKYRQLDYFSCCEGVVCFCPRLIWGYSGSWVPAKISGIYINNGYKVKINVDFTKTFLTGYQMYTSNEEYSLLSPKILKDWEVLYLKHHPDFFELMLANAYESLNSQLREGMLSSIKLV